MKKILIIDDEPDSIAVYEYLLSKLDYKVLSITNPLEALKTIFYTSPDLIILDWLMPQKEGIEVLKEIKAVTEISEIPVIISSGIRTQSSNLRAALEAGAVDFIKKPIDEIELEARVASAIQLHRCFADTRRMQQEIHAKELELADAKVNFYQNELNKKEREMIVSAVSIFQNKKLITVLKTEIDAEFKEFSEEQKLQLITLLERYENISNSFNWEMFERRFIELNSDFFNRIKADYPTLSTGEQHLCAFFKLGLSLKEISILNYSSYEAIRKAVYRLRKKLNLNEKVEVNLFFQKY